MFSFSLSIYHLLFFYSVACMTNIFPSLHKMASQFRQMKGQQILRSSVSETPLQFLRLTLKLPTWVSVYFFKLLAWMGEDNDLTGFCISSLETMEIHVQVILNQSNKWVCSKKNSRAADKGEMDTRQKTKSTKSHYITVHLTSVRTSSVQ